MGDVNFVATFDDKAVSRGFDSVASKAKQSAQQVDQSFSKAGNASEAAFNRMTSQAARFFSVAKSVQFLSTAMDEYGKKNIDVASSLDKVADAKDALIEGIGKDIAPLLDLVVAILEKADEVRNKITNFIVDMPGKLEGAWKYLTTGDKNAFKGTDKGEQFDAIAKQQVRAQKELAEKTIIANEELHTREKKLRSENRLFEADEIKNRIDFNNKMEQIAKRQKTEKLSGSTVSALQQLARDEKAVADKAAKEAEEDRKRQLDQTLRAGAAQLAQEDEKERQEQKQWQIAQQQLQIEQEKMAIESQSLKNSIDGNKDVVAIMQTKLQLHERLNAIQDNENIDAEQRQYLATQARANALEQIVHTLENPTMSKEQQAASSAVLNAGAGSIGMAAVFGNQTYADPPGLKEAREQLSVARESLKHLADIALWAKDMATGGDTTVARFGL